MKSRRRTGPRGEKRACTRYSCKTKLLAVRLVRRKIAPSESIRSRSRGAHASELSAVRRPKSRAQGRPGTGRCPWSACNKKARGRTTGSAEHARPSLRDGFNGCFVLSPGTGFLAPVSRQCETHCARHQHRDARTIRLDRAHRVVRRHDEITLQHRYAHRISASRVVTIAIRPSCRGGTSDKKA
jgi:hypothetical protein